MPASDHPEHAEDFRALAELAEVFTDLVTALRCGEGRSLSPSGIVDLAIRCMPRAQHVAISAHVDGALRDVAASSGLPAQVDRIRAETGEGPAFDLVESNDLVLTDDLNDEPRWPAFSRRTLAETGVFYSDWPFAFDQIAISTGAIFAAYTSLCAGQELVVGEPVGRERAGEVHREIGVAVGILIAGSGLSTEAGYQRLHSASQVLGQSLAQTARHVIDHRRLPE